MPTTILNHHPLGGHPLVRLLAGFKYKKDWKFDVYKGTIFDEGGGVLRISIRCIDSGDPGLPNVISHNIPIPPWEVDEEEFWANWLLEQISLVDIHEAMEFFELNGVKVFNPHRKGQSPYLIKYSKEG